MQTRQTDNPVEFSTNGTQVSLRDLIGLREKSRQLDISPHGNILATRSGGHLSRFRGRGMEFDESRQYVAGDDTRNMDWRVTARTGKAHIKQYREERERPVWLLVDLGESMRFGTRSTFKSVVAARAAAMLAWSATEQGDRIGGLIFDENRHYEQRPAPRTRGLLPLLQALALNPSAGRPGGYISITEAATRLTRLVRPGSLVFILSDFYGLNPDNVGWLARLSEHNEVVFAEISDPLERSAPPPGIYPVSDGTEQRVLDISSRKKRRTYQQWCMQKFDMLTTLARRYNTHQLSLDTAQPVTAALRDGLHPRSVPAGRIVGA